MAAPCKNYRCAFFGSDATNGYCSKCFEALVKQDQTTMTTTKSPAGATNLMSDGTVVLLSKTIASAAALDDQPTRNVEVEANDGATSTRGVARGQPVEEEAGSSTATMVEMADNTSSQRSDNSSHCYFCNKKIRLTDKYDCKCGKVFCSTHRHFKEHSCTYDYKASGRAAIAKANPIVKGSKLKKI